MNDYFTPPETTKLVLETLLQTLTHLGVDMGEYTFIEPSAGDGAFLPILPDTTISLDINPRHKDVIQQDYLTYLPPPGKYVVFGNPPFGFRGKLALDFINHSVKFAEFVAFILPQMFGSDGKGNKRDRVVGYNLLYSGTVPNSFYLPNGRETKVNVIFQIWGKNYHSVSKKIENLSGVRVYSIRDSRGRCINKAMIDKCDKYVSSTCFGQSKMKSYSVFDDLPYQRGYGMVFPEEKSFWKKVCEDIDWSEVAFLSTNGALNLRRSLIWGALNEHIHHLTSL